MRRPPPRRQHRADVAAWTARSGGSIFRDSATGFTIRRRRRPRGIPGLLAVSGLVAGAVLAVQGVAEIEQPRVSTDAAAHEAVGARPVDDEPVVDGEALEDDVAAVPVVFARAGPVQLTLPTARPLVVGFHESSSRYAKPLDPAGRVVANRNPTRFEPPQADADGPSYLVLSSRGRMYPPTSSVDIAMERDDPVLAPVDGTVTDVRDYLLYGRHRDQRIEIQPDAASALRVVVLHVERARVTPGDTVRAGETIIASSARPLPFASHIDRDVPGGVAPHVHVEVVDADAPRPDALAGVTSAEVSP